MPLRPQSLSTVVRPTEVDLTWETAPPNGATVTGYLVQVHEAGGGVAVFDQALSEAARTQKVTGLTTGAMYIATVAGVNELGTGETRTFGPFEAAGRY